MKTKIVSAFSLTILAVALCLYSVADSTPNQEQPVVDQTDTTTSVYRDADFPANTTLVNQATAQNHSTVDADKHAASILKESIGEPEIPYYLLGTVNDPGHSSTWSHTAIQADLAWDLSTGSEDVVIAIIDTGYALAHEDLADKWHLNPGEMGETQPGDQCWTGTPVDKQTNDCDDDNNGYVDDWRGYDFYNNDSSPQAGEVNPSGEGVAHGSMVAGTASATANNNKGSAGIDHNAKIMPLQVFSDEGEAYTTDIVAAIQYATENGASIINLSLGTNMYDTPLRSAIQYARSQGVFVVAASGNCALNDQAFCNNLPAPGRMAYPALYPEVFAVGSTTSTDSRAGSSSYGPQLGLTAPGASVGPLPAYTAGNQTTAYAVASGTSFAAPLTAGVTSLLIAQNPSITISQLEAVLTESTDKVAGMGGSSFTNEYGYGRLNAHRATLLGLAKTQEHLLGASELSSRQLAVGAVWRTSTGNITDDESLLVGCRVFAADRCSVTVQNGAIYRFMPVSSDKIGSLQYIFIKGNAVPSGTWQVSIHSREYASLITNLTR